MVNNKKYVITGRYMIACMLLILVAFSSCKKKSEPQPEQETGTVSDIDGNVYKTVKIGDQWWMTENLKVKHYRDNTDITEIKNSETEKWKLDITGSYCNSSKGVLYNWYTVHHSTSIAPEGWHVPTDEDWKQLEQYLGMSAEETDKTSWRGTNEGDKLKVKQNLPPNWTRYGEVWGTNESGFTALPSNCRMFDGTWGDGNNGNISTAFFWSSTLHDQEAWYRYLDYKNSNVFRYHGPKSYGFSIRCIKN